jgi:hypothetical protein
MPERSFSRVEVTRAFRTFRDRVSDLLKANYWTWEAHFRRLIHHCETNPVMHIVTEPLRRNPSVNGKAFVGNHDHRGGMDAPPYQLPVDDDDLTALLYQGFLYWNGQEGDLSHALLQFYGNAYLITDSNAGIAAINQELVEPFAREVGYRLEDIEAGLGNEDHQVPAERLVVFHYYDHSRTEDHSVNIHGSNVQGSNVAGTGATISHSTATYNSNAELAEALKALKPLVKDVAAEQRKAVDGALDRLVEAARKDIPVAMVAPDVKTVAEASPGLGDTLKDIGLRVGSSVTASGIFQAIKMYFGLH